MKRACTSSSSDLTGGTGDVNPQILSYISNRSYSNQTGSQGTTQYFNNPVWEMNRAGNLAGGACNKKAYVMEVLKVWLYVENLALLAAGNGAQVANNYLSLSYDAAPQPDLPVGSGPYQSFNWLNDSETQVPQNSTNILASAQNGSWSAAQPTGSPVAEGSDAWKETDLTDGAGHGVIVGQPVFNLRSYVRWDVTAPGASGTYLVGVRILYRVKGIAYDEWVRQFTFGV